MLARPFIRLTAILLVGTGIAATPALAVVVVGDTSSYGTYNTSAPPNLSDPTDVFPAFNNVGVIGGGSGVYIGNGYVLTAVHVGGTTGGAITFSNAPGGLTYYPIAGSGVQLHNPTFSGSPDVVAQSGQPIDLTLFRVTDTPGGTTVAAVPLSPLNISASRVTASTPLFLAGSGLDREDLAGDSDIEPDGKGYMLATSRTLRYGKAISTGTGLFNDGFYTQYGFETPFLDTTGYATAVGGDSGGGAFDQIGNTLRGIILARDQMANVAYFGDNTFSVDLALYRSQIVAIVPEPASAALFGCVGAVALLRRRALR